MRRIIIDTDTASDDAVALLLALRAPEIKVEAITIVAGNVDFDQEAENALYTVEMGGKSGEVPVHCGARRPLVREVHRTVQNVHGRDGMGGSFYPRTRQRPEKEHAVDAIVRLANAYAEEISIVAIAPLTNIALALYNPWVDPEAARIVMHSAIPLTMIGFEASCRYSVFTDTDYQRVEKLATPLARFFLDINRTRRIFCKQKQRLAGSNHPDALTMAIFMDSSIATRTEKRYVDVETAGELTRGMIVIDEFGVWGKEPNVTICAEADERRFKDLIFSTLEGA